MELMDCVAPSMTASELESFWSKMDRSGECWLWTAAKSEKGYGVFAVSDAGRSRVHKAHRIAYMLLVGPIPNGLCLLHRCDTPACCRPDHTYPGTRSDNNKDMTRKGRHRRGGSVTPVDECDYERGEWHHNVKLTNAIVLALRADRRSGMSYSKLMMKYKVSFGAVVQAANYITWRHVA